VKTRKIDRIFAIWQALHPDSSKHPERWVTKQANKDGTYITKAGVDETNHTPLAPFRKNQHDYWTSDAIKRTATFGYAYPETQRWKFANEEDYQSAILDSLKGTTTSSLALLLASDAPNQKAALTKIEEVSTFWQDFTPTPDFKGRS